MDFKDFKEFYDANKNSAEMTTFISTEFLSYAKSDDGLNLLQPILDSHGSKVVEAYKGKGMEAEFEKRLGAEREKIKLEYNPIVDPRDQKLAELEARLNKKDEEILKSGIEADALKALKYSELSNLINITTDKDRTMASVNTINESIEKMVNAEVESRLKGKVRTLDTGDVNKYGGASNPFDPKTLNITEQQNLYASNPEKARELAAMANRQL